MRALALLSLLVGSVRALVFIVACILGYNCSREELFAVLVVLALFLLLSCAASLLAIEKNTRDR